MQKKKKEKWLSRVVSVRPVHIKWPWSVWRITKDTKEKERKEIISQ